ncbi:MAG: DNA primase [Pseudomonadota bacterium]
MARIPEDFIQQVLDRTDIVAVVERYVPLKKAGINYQARCPFHNEKSPSFTVSPTKQFYHCFGCGAHGTAISFLMEHAGYGFVDAVKELAGAVGMQIPDDGQPHEEDGRRNRILAHLDAAGRFYRQALKGHAPAVDYLKGRGLTGETAARFGLGYAPDDWQGLKAAVADYQEAALEEAGLVIVNEGKRYDRFRDRVMFPIRNERGLVIGFGGRVMGKGEPKYLNSPETPVFHKGRELYGLHEHRRAIQQADRVIVVEGYMDVVMLDQHGVDNAVATLGTAITADQAARLLRLADEVVFAFDGDNAGRKAAWRALENCLPQAQDGKRMSFLFLPEGEDPDSFVRAQGAEAFRKLCDRATPLSDFLFAELGAQTDLDSEEGKVRLAKLAEPYLAKLAQAPLLGRALRQRLAELTGMAPPRERRMAGRAEAPRRPPAAAGRGRVQASPWRVLLQGLLHDPKRASQLGDLPEPAGEEAHILHGVLSVAREHPEFTTRDVVEHFRGRPEQASIEAAAAALLLWDKDYDVDADFAGALAAVRREGTKALVGSIAGRRPSDLSAEEKALLLASLNMKKPGA